MSASTKYYVMINDPNQELITGSDPRIATEPCVPADARAQLKILQLKEEKARINAEAYKQLIEQSMCIQELDIKIQSNKKKYIEEGQNTLHSTVRELNAYLEKDIINFNDELITEHINRLKSKIGELKKVKETSKCLEDYDSIMSLLKDESINYEKQLTAQELKQEYDIHEDKNEGATKILSNFYDKAKSELIQIEGKSQ